jgi:hypothetical protein
LRMAVDDAADDVGEIGGWLDGVEFAGFDERSDDGPMLGSFIRSDLMMPGVWGGKWWSIIPFTRCLGARQSWSPTNSTTASDI